MPGVDPTRVQKEIREISSDTASGVVVELVGDSLQKMVGTVPGPADTPYAGGIFRWVGLSSAGC